jgi:2'-5' RNA ligase
MQTLRLFISINLESTLNERIEALIKEASLSIEGVSWVKPANSHITLKFLGATKIEKINEINEKLKFISLRHRAFEMSVEGVGCFPEKRSPRVIWTAIGKGSAEIINLVGDIDTHLFSLGIVKGDKKYVPHISVGRVKRLSNKIQAISSIEKLSGFQIGTMFVNNFSLMQSDLKKEGPVYTRLYNYFLSSK